MPQANFEMAMRILVSALESNTLEFSYATAIARGTVPATGKVQAKALWAWAQAAKTSEFVDEVTVCQKYAKAEAKATAAVSAEVPWARIEVMQLQ